MDCWCAVKAHADGRQTTVVRIERAGEYDEQYEGFNYIAVEVLQPKIFLPSLNIFQIHADVPKEISKAIKESYKLFWLDSSSCGNKIRTVVELIMDEQKIAKCAIDQAYRDGKINWQKPISCHLYPIRIKKFKDYEAVNYDKWDVCKPACECGKKLDVPVYKFLKEPLIRKYGKAWFKQLEQSAKLYLKG